MYERAGKIQNYLTQPFFTVEDYTGRPGKYVALADTLANCHEIVSGRCDNIEEEKFYMIGTLEEIKE